MGLGEKLTVLGHTDKNKKKVSTNYYAMYI